MSTSPGEKYEKVAIKWLDAFAQPQEWLEIDSYKPSPVIPTTVGFLIPDFIEGYITHADSYYESNGSVFCYGIGHIPKGMVLEITSLTTGRKLKLV